MTCDPWTSLLGKEMNMYFKYINQYYCRINTRKIKNENYA